MIECTVGWFIVRKKYCSLAEKLCFINQANRANGLIFWRFMKVTSQFFLFLERWMDIVYSYLIIAITAPNSCGRTRSWSNNVRGFRSCSEHGRVDWQGPSQIGRWPVIHFFHYYYIYFLPFTQNKSPSSASLFQKKLKEKNYY